MAVKPGGTVISVAAQDIGRAIAMLVAVVAAEVGTNGRIVRDYLY